MEEIIFVAICKGCIFHNVENALYQEEEQIFRELIVKKTRLTNRGFYLMPRSVDLTWFNHGLVPEYYSSTSYLLKWQLYEQVDIENGKYSLGTRLELIYYPPRQFWSNMNAYCL